jgi:ribosomal protein S18 acetylase RimI-like enzyme
VREAEPPDYESVLGLLRVAHTTTIGDSAGAVPGPRTSGLEAVLTDSKLRVLVAVEQAAGPAASSDGAQLAPGTGPVVGVAVLAPDALSGLLDLPCLYVSTLVVAPERRHRGIGRSLLVAATTFAEDSGVEHVVVGLASSSREEARHLARLGFAPLTSLRIASVAALRRTLRMRRSIDATRFNLARGRTTGDIRLPPRLPRPRRGGRGGVR